MISMPPKIKKETKNKKPKKIRTSEAAAIGRKVLTIGFCVPEIYSWCTKLSPNPNFLKRKIFYLMQSVYFNDGF